MPKTPSPNAEDVLTQLVTGPSIREVAATALRPELDRLYPQLQIDPTVAIVVTPTWRITGDRVVPGNNRFESLTDALVRTGLYATTVTYIDGEHFLTLHPGDEPATQLPVKIDAIGCLINELAPLLFIAYQQQQLDYWNQAIRPDTPRWHQLSVSLQNIWNIDTVPGWDADQKAMAHGVFIDPDRATRRVQDKYLTKACLIDIDIDAVQGQTKQHLQVLDICVLVGTSGSRNLVLTHSLAEGFKQYDSLEALGGTLLKRIGGSMTHRTVQWRLYEPSGNFFHHQACALIALEAEAIGSLADDPSASLPGFSAQVSAATNSFSDFHALPTSHFSKVQTLVPDWLKNAEPADLTRYSRHLMDLAQLREQDGGKSFLDAIPSLTQFTLQALRKQMDIDHPQTAPVNLENIQISITSVAVLGTVIVPGKTQNLTLSLVELALQNLVAVPLGNKTVQDKTGAAVPDWMTAAYLETLVTTLNIGETYPALIKRQLLSDPAQTLERQALYVRHLRVQLPLQALQFKIRGERGIDERGYRYTAAAMLENPAERFVDEQKIVIRPLAFITGESKDSLGDEVANMFVIGPRHADQGPCLLYRPLLDPPLIQYPGEANLLYAIKQDRSLRESVLAWLADDVRFNYSQYVFPGKLPSAWTLTQLLVDPTSVFASMGRVSLAASLLDEDPVVAMFNANANALITLADRQTVSNAEARWETFKQGAWMLFNLALPFLGRTAGTAAWIWQILDDLQEVVDGQENNDSQQSATALTDLLLTLGMVLAHQAAARYAPRLRSSEKTAISLPTPETTATKITVARLPDVTATQLPSSHEIYVHATAALPATDLGVFLDGLAIAEPKGVSFPSQDTGPYQHLSTLNKKWYAKVAHRWFEVTLNDNSDVQIIDSRQSPHRTGPLLIRNAKGQWFIDTRLRLRGGGRREQLQKANKQHRVKLKEQIMVFEGQKAAFSTQLNAAEAALVSAPSSESTQHFLDAIDSQLMAISTNIELIKTYNALETIPNFRSAMISRLEFQLSLAMHWFRLQKTTFEKQMDLSLALINNDALDDPRPPRQIHQHTSELTETYINKIEFAHSRFSELSLLGKEAADVTRRFKAALPPFALQNLKLLQISMAQELCLNDSGTLATADARAALEGVVENAGLTIQSSMDLAADDDVLRLAERIDALSDLLEQFATVDEHIAGLPTDYPEELSQPSLDLMRKRVAAFNQDAVKHLATLLRERQIIEPQPGPSRAAAVPVKRIIKTRFKGTVVGQTRNNAAGQDSGLVDVISPMTGKVIATFHEKTPGVWLERNTTKKTVEVKPKPDVNKSIQASKALLDGVTAFKKRTEADIKRVPRIPKEIEEIYYQYASRLRNAMSEIDQKPTTSNSTELQIEGPSPLQLQLEQAANALYEEGRRKRVEMTKQQPPTAARVEWLKSKNEVEISKPDTTRRRRLKSHKKDYLLEYAILDSGTRQVLWYAHFHYPKPDSPVHDFTAAHLKTAQQRNLGGQYDVRGATSDAQAISIYRSEISPQLASSLFLS